MDTDRSGLRRGAKAVQQLLTRLAQNESMGQALEAVVGLDYQEFQIAWEADLDR